jgi:hypothetical protein
MSPQPPSPAAFVMSMPRLTMDWLSGHDFQASPPASWSGVHRPARA